PPLPGCLGPDAGGASGLGGSPPLSWSGWSGWVGSGSLYEHTVHVGSMHVSPPPRAHCHTPCLLHPSSLPTLKNKTLNSDVNTRSFLSIFFPQKEFATPPPLLFRKLSNPDLSPAATAATKSKLHRQLSQDESRARRSSMLAGQGLSGGIGAGMAGTSADVNNLIRMRGQALGQSAPSLTGAALVHLKHVYRCIFPTCFKCD
uniref:Uncharacterized protein n=1 Tax=Oryzias latipes TaxID=8090 RepID=H2MDZ8_ORYLA